ncbi:LLM class flavin-dependent oxidoreductase [Natrinema halophilum]|uniref:LLM class flavin-dependent oxidoreductase n=1 Tax=Natrinema halophilum TaxID=1699371 RepID=A0A7D5KS73_9EURY|nr:LLM class flavin-dependent oxidoreductase [Natrinema halophilum]QLG50077.1 LLM class flavin-dependent oxidoreductase [Natrinema halophilum]
MGDIAIGVGLGQFHDGLPEPEELFRYVERADELGIDSIWLPDHVISERPELDTTVLMSVIAARTRDIKMGPSVLTLPARNPVAVANTYANLDYLTGGRGRVIMAVGLGADPRLCDVLGISSAQRPERLREAIELMRRLWTEDSVDYDGEHYQLNGVTVTPKPAQGTLDIWIGGNSDAALKRVARYGDGWFPALMSPQEFNTKLDRLMAFCDEVGREVERDEAGVILPSYVARDPDRAREIKARVLERRGLVGSSSKFEECSAFGTPVDCVETIQKYVDAGCTKFVLMPAGPPSERIGQLELYSREVLPELSSSTS